MVSPVEIIGLGQAQVRFVWDDDTEVTWPTRTLRLRCTCALCVSEHSGLPLLDPTTVPADITIKDMSLVGNYGVGVVFSELSPASQAVLDRLLAQRDQRGK